MELDRLIFFKKKKKIGLAGWWGGRNEGDRYILKTLKRSFGRDFDLDVINIPFRGDPSMIGYLNKLDFLIIGGGGLFTINFPEPFDTYDEWGKSLKTPFGFLGVGVQEVNERLSGTFASIIEKSTFFSVRDTGSYEISKKYSDKADKIFDLTFLSPRKITTSGNDRTMGVNLRVWNFDDRRTYDNSAWCHAINGLKQPKIKIPLSFLHGIDDRKAMEGIASGYSRTFSMGLYKKIGLMLGMRLHSLVFAVQNNIPPIGISYTPKIQRFFDDMNLQEFCLGINDHDKLSGLVERANNDKKRIGPVLDGYNDHAHRAVARYIDNVVETIKNL